MTGLFAPTEGATPIPPDEQKKLIPSWITTREDLNVAEEDNIGKGLAWAQRRRAKSLTIATDAYSRAIHKAMFGDVWRWAGEYRKIELEGIGAPSWRTANDCAVLFDNFRYWIEHGTYPPDELAVRFHHQLVFVHPFTNGNGRHSRMMADLLVESLGGKAFTWGDGDLQDTGELRETYIATLKKADANDIDDLLAFART